MDDRTRRERAELAAEIGRLERAEPRDKAERNWFVSQANRLVKEADRRVRETASRLTEASNSLPLELRQTPSLDLIQPWPTSLPDAYSEYKHEFELAQRATAARERLEPGPIHEHVVFGADAEMAPASRRKDLVEAVSAEIAQGTDLVRGFDGLVLVSIVFCRPDTLVFHDLKREYAYLDERSGDAWNLYFAGYKGIAGQGRKLPPSAAGIPLWRFDAAQFHQIRQWIERNHARSLKHDNVPAGLTPWRLTARAELVSVLAYGQQGEDPYFDWPSLKAVPLRDLDNKGEHDLARIVDVMVDWRRSEDPTFRELAPGEPPGGPAATSVLSLESIVSAAAKTAGILGAGVATNAAYELLKSIISP